MFLGDAFVSGQPDQLKKLQALQRSIPAQSDLFSIMRYGKLAKHMNIQKWIQHSIPPENAVDSILYP
jgi:hypothetical protein